MDRYIDRNGFILYKSRNLTPVEHLLDFELRAKRNGHRGAVIWLTGLSASGKSTIAMETERRLFQRGYQAYVLDGDNIRQGLNADLGFSPDDRAENIRRIGEVAALMADAGIVVISAFISPYKADREKARMVARGRFYEFYIKASLEECKKRDPKGLYKKAHLGDIEKFTGISAPYEEPDSPELIIDTEKNNINDSVSEIINYIENNLKLSSNFDEKDSIVSVGN